MKSKTARMIRQRRIVGLFVSMPLLLAGVDAMAAPHDIDLAQPCSNANDTIFAPSGSPIHVDIGALNAPAGNLEWSFDSIPFAYGGAGPCSGANPVTCNNIAVTLPAPAPASVTTVDGTANTGDGGFQMTLLAEVGTTGCDRQYIVQFIQPFQSVLVLDRSGSMGGSTHIDPPATSRWDAVHKSVNNFVPFFVDAGTDAGSELGMTLFNNAVIANTHFSNALETITDAPGFASDIDDELSQSPGGSTGIGTGLESAIAKFTNPSIPRSIVLFTDGEQNQAPHVELNGKYLNQKRPWEAGYVECTDAAHGHADCSEIPTDINIVTIGIGQPSGDYLTMLQNLATTHNGNYIVTRTSDAFTYAGAGSVGTGSITDAFTLEIAPVLQNNSPQLVASYRDLLTGPGVVTLPAFKVNNFVTGLVIQVVYDRNFELPQLLSLYAGIRVERDGDDVTPYFVPRITGNYTNTITLRTDFRTDELPAIDPQGEYVVRMIKPENIKDLQFKLVSFADDHRFDMDWDLEPVAPIVGQSFKPRMRLSWMGNPLETASVEAYVLRPDNDLGDTLASYGGTIDPSSAPDAGTPGYQKYMYLLENDPAFLALLEANQDQLTLTHQGDGVYEAAVNPGDISGIYQILYRVTHDSVDTGAIERLAMQSAYVRVAPMDAAASGLSSSYEGKMMTIAMRPVSTVGKLYGPGQENLVRINGNGINIIDARDDQTGGYEFDIACADGCSPDTEISVTVLGDAVFTGTVGEFVGQDGGTDGFMPQWLLWLLIILVVVILAWLVSRILSGSSS